MTYADSIFPSQVFLTEALLDNLDFGRCINACVKWENTCIYSCSDHFVPNKEKANAVSTDCTWIFYRGFFCFRFWRFVFGWWTFIRLSAYPVEYCYSLLHYSSILHLLHYLQNRNTHNIAIFSTIFKYTVLISSWI